MRSAVCLVLAASSLASVGCGPMPVALRSDVSAIELSRRLDGLTVGVTRVRDLRADAPFVGNHRDGLLRVPQFPYALDGDATAFVRRLTELTLLANGARLSSDGAPADFAVQIDILEIDLTTDGALAGEETFGRVQLALRVLDDLGDVVHQRTITRPFTDEELNDRGLVGDALRDAVLTAVSEIEAPAKPPAPGEFATVSR